MTYGVVAIGKRLSIKSIMVVVVMRLLICLHSVELILGRHRDFHQLREYYNC